MKNYYSSVIATCSLFNGNSFESFLGFFSIKWLILQCKCLSVTKSKMCGGICSQKKTWHVLRFLYCNNISLLWNTILTKWCSETRCHVAINLMKGADENILIFLLKRQGRDINIVSIRKCILIIILSHFFLSIKIYIIFFFHHTHYTFTKDRPGLALCQSMWTLFCSES